jgi:hypothetical protein
MDIIFNVGREVEVNHGLDIFDIETSRSDICRNHDWRASILEILQCPVPLVLVLVTMNC